MLPIENNNYIENEYFLISIDDKGIINIYDKKRQINYKDAIYFEDDGDEGDSYDYSEPAHNVYLRDINVINVDKIINTLKSTLYITVDMPLPYNLKERVQGKIP